MSKLVCFALVAFVAAEAPPPVISLDIDESMSLHKEKHALATDMNQDWVERCDAKTKPSQCPFPKARAFDSHDKAVTVTTTMWVMDIENVPQGCDKFAKNCKGKQVAKVDFDRRSTYVFKYDAKDEASNHASQVVFVLELNDVHYPELTACGQPIQYVEGARPFPFCESKATDNIGVGAISYKMKSTTGVPVFDNKTYKQAHDYINKMVYNPRSLGKYVIYMTVNDNAGIYRKNPTDAITRGNQVTATRGLVIRDTAKPWITIPKNSAKDNRVECSPAAFSDVGAILHDHYWAAPWNKKAATTTENTVDMTKIGAYSVRYNGKDVANNMAEERVRTVYVQDKLAPVIALKGASIEHHWSEDKWIDAGVTTADQCDKSLPSPKIWWSGVSDRFNQKALGIHIRNYKVCDHVNLCSTVTRKIVIADNKKPKLNLVGESSVMSVATLADEPYKDAGAKCSDYVDGELHHTISSSIKFQGKPVTSVDRATVGKYTITYKCKDASLNFADEVVRTVTVVDRQCPKMTLKGSGLISLEAGVSTYTEPGFTASDDIDGNLVSYAKTTLKFNGKAYTGKVDTSKVGTYVMTYTVKDLSGNAQCKVITRKVVVKDTLPPVIQLKILKGKQLSASGQTGLDSTTNTAHKMF